ncbi:MAG TPA: sugar transferase [Anaerolineae bacterium]|nr:sugar transferase [Anaerolineae bacterium]
MSTRSLLQDWKTLQPSRAQSRRAEWHNLRLALLLVDTVAIVTTFALAYVIRFAAELPLFYMPEETPLAFYTVLVVGLIPIWLFIFSLHRLYDFNLLLTGLDEYVHIVQATSLGMMVVITVSFFIPAFVIARGWLVLTWAFSTVGVIGGRFTVRRIVEAIRSQGRFTTPVLIIGANEEGRAIANHLRESPALGARVVGFLDDRVDAGRELGPGLRVLGMIDEAADWIKRHDVSEVIVCSSALTRAELLDVYQVFALRDDVALRLSSGLFEMLTTGMRVKQVGSVALMSANRTRLSASERAIKRIFDLLLAAAALIALAPLMVALAIWVKLDSPGPIIHRRRVLSANGKTFDAFKFRTMVINSAEVLARYPELVEQFNRDMKLKEDPRVTRVGKVLRKLSFDELPQLFNVLLGQMSLVGPRMITPEEAERYGQWRFNLLTVKPGITGLWQVSGRSDVSYSERVQIDMSYIRNYSLWIDLMLIARTIPAIFKKRGAY